MSLRPLALARSMGVLPSLSVASVLMVKSQCKISVRGISMHVAY